MSETSPVRVDEVSDHYEPAKTAEITRKCLFWVIAAVSLYMPYLSTLAVPVKNGLQSGFIVLAILHFTISQMSRFYLVPKAEHIRRQQMLSNAFGTSLTHEQTALYYNNDYSPSMKRLGANAMENSLFSKEIAERMLIKSRFIICGYIICWIVAFSLRHNNLELLTWITQFVFSGEIIVQWLSLEVLRFRHQRTFELLHAHFLHEIGGGSPKAVATILDAFVSYEAAKSSAGLLLSTRVFEDLNHSLTLKWEQIRKDLNMTAE